MRSSVIGIVSLGLALAIGWNTIDSLPAEQSTNITGIEGDASRGAYALQLGGCQACHTTEGGGAFAGGVAIATRFGTFYGPNITPSEEGIGDWSPENFADAVINGSRPQGDHYYPTFPFTSYANLTKQDVMDMWAGLQAIEPSTEPSKPHEINLVLKSRKPAAAWKVLFGRSKFASHRIYGDRLSGRQRGEYIVNGPGHCNECHTPRNVLGAMKRDQAFAGATLPGEKKNEKVPAITPEALREAGWTKSDLKLALKFGIELDGDVMGGSMGEVIEGSLSHLTDDDIDAIATYLLDE